MRGQTFDTLGQLYGIGHVSYLECINKESVILFNLLTDEKPPSSGRIPDWKHFDPTFFGLHPKLAQNCDPAKSLTLERSFEAILDSGNY